MTPPEPAVKAITLLSRVLPKAKLVPQKDLAELVFRELKKRKMVCSSFTFLYFMTLIYIISTVLYVLLFLAMGGMLVALILYIT